MRSSRPTTASTPRWRRRGGLRAEPPFALVARATRSTAVESWHFGAAAVVTPGGALVGRVGDPTLATYLRSAAKPVQVLPLLLAGGAERFALEAADLALVCASHGGTPAHTARAAALLARGGFGEEDLRCGPHPPMDEESAAVLLAGGETPRAIHNNCSGKHAGMLLTCALRGYPAASYLEPEHPLQREILQHLVRLSGVAERDIPLAADGCSVPTFHLPLSAAARAYAALADPGAAGIDEPRAAALTRVADAMTAAPGMVAGPGRFTTRLMEVCGRRIVGKEGAEGLYCLAVRGPVALGVAIKIADGSGRCRDGVVLDLLTQLGVLSGAELAALDGYRRVPVRNANGWTVGEVVPDVELEEVPG